MILKYMEISVLTSELSIIHEKSPITSLLNPDSDEFLKEIPMKKPFTLSLILKQ